ncbi:T9SS type A sorting domain-containing protein [Psychroserpens sp.]|uniref:T9SS type A sorting domain-containing protein n=1 Tax=Psychroserpens sp. TaxID=2020870 RepID=UPI002B27AFAD|nr:T9SS type A sorting domain-containing protein [Psychroserpens sp.]
MIKKLTLLAALTICTIGYGQTTELVHLKLRLSSNSNSYNTDIYFNDNATLGFDVGYDAGFFGVIPNFAIYSHLVEDNAGLALALQAVNTTDLSDVTIPLGVNANQGQQITFSISQSTLPASANVYLNDTVTNTSTLLNNTDYTVTPASTLSGTGRFFLRISETYIAYTFDGSWLPSDPSGTNSAGPSGSDLIIISGNAALTANTGCNSVTVNPGASLTVNNSVNLLASSGISLESNSTTYSSFIVNGSFSGTVNYNRFVNSNANGNDLVSSPVFNTSWSNFLSAGNNAADLLDDGNTSPTTYAFAPFDKSIGDFSNYNSTTSATLTNGIGYRVATDSGTTLTFSGNSVVGTIMVNIQNFGPSFEEWNLVGNPYPSYLNVQSFLSGEVSPGVKNINLFEPTSAAIYGYDGNATNGWTIYNLANTNASTVMAPGQGFFVSANVENVAAYNLQFKPDMQSTGTSDDFIVGRNNELIYLKLDASTATDSYTTEFYFNNNSSLGMDSGYDATLFGSTPEFAMYSHLVEDNEGKPIALQSLNITDVSATTIPLGIHANQGEQITFSIADSTMPSSINVYLDDTVTNTTTLLNTSNYVVSTATALSGTGRFFLRTSEDALSVIEDNLDAIQVYANKSQKMIFIKGQLQGTTKINIYDIQGRQVHTSELDSRATTNQIDVSNLMTGAYIVNLYNNTQQKTQKVIIN